jgi:hypothetical protein
MFNDNRGLLPLPGRTLLAAWDLGQQTHDFIEPYRIGQT